MNPFFLCFDDLNILNKSVTSSYANALKEHKQFKAALCGSKERLNFEKIEKQMILIEQQEEKKRMLKHNEEIANERKKMQEDSRKKQELLTKTLDKWKTKCDNINMKIRYFTEEIPDYEKSVISEYDELVEKEKKLKSEIQQLKDKIKEKEANAKIKSLKRKIIDPKK